MIVHEGGGRGRRKERKSESERRKERRGEEGEEDRTEVKRSKGDRRAGSEGRGGGSRRLPRKARHERPARRLVPRCPGAAGTSRRRAPWASSLVAEGDGGEGQDGRLGLDLDGGGQALARGVQLAQAGHHLAQDLP